MPLVALERCQLTLRFSFESQRAPLLVGFAVLICIVLLIKLCQVFYDCN